MSSMNFMVHAKVGDRFRWDRSGEICRITAIDDGDIHFRYETGRWKGQTGYTTVPQEVELLTVLDELADIE